MTAFEAGLRVAAGGGLHAALLLLLPWSISSDVDPATAFTVLLVIYVALLVLTTLPGLVAFSLQGRKESHEGSPQRLRTTKATSASLAGLLYFALPFTFVLTEGFTSLIASFSVMSFAVGFLLHRLFLAVSFAGASGRALPAAALSLPIALLLVITWPF